MTDDEPQLAPEVELALQMANDQWTRHVGPQPFPRPCGTVMPTVLEGPAVARRHHFAAGVVVGAACAAIVLALVALVLALAFGL